MGVTGLKVRCRWAAYLPSRAESIAGPFLVSRGHSHSRAQEELGESLARNQRILEWGSRQVFVAPSPVGGKRLSYKAASQISANCLPPLWFFAFFSTLSDHLPLLFAYFLTYFF